MAIFSCAARWRTCRSPGRQRMSIGRAWRPRGQKSRPSAPSWAQPGARDAPTRLVEATPGGAPVGRQLWEPLCAALQRFDPAGVSRVLD